MGGLVDIPLSRLTVARAGTAMRVNSAGLIEAVAANAPRIDYDPVTLAPRGLLVEEARINRVAYSQQIDLWSDPLSNTTVTANAATAPDGTATADTLGSAATSGDRLRRWTVTVPNDAVARVFSIFAKPGTGSKVNLALAYGGGASKATFCTFDLLAGTSTLTGGVNEGFGMERWPGGWWRCWVVLANNSTGNTMLVADLRPCGHPINTAAGDVVVWGAQVEDGAFPTSYIPTTTAPVTRNADIIGLPLAGLAGWNPVAFSLVVNAQILSGAARTAAVWEIGDGSHNNRLSLARFSGFTGANLFAFSGGVASFDGGFAPRDATPFCVAMAATAGDMAGAQDGVLTSNTIGSMALPQGLTTLRLGSDVWGSVMTGYIRRLQYFPRRVSNAELQALTA